ncbi:hypothetical protein DAEQUDRAFT_763009 [Daedalea quercina L-15889]|uniref:Uncharacterized protein n=1 Tax=Daedalea quercina L-15889 TaxID=1314783 RepID=A0A165SNP2_9APHY|nr:hypothetical protein DAEQUDRAFT_763009 [Daedalea quercina L-15889]
MVATFILTRTFAICALIVGALPLAQAAPIDSAAVAEHIGERNCRILGCLRFVLPHDNTSTADSTVDTTVKDALSGVEQPSSAGTAREIARDLLARELDTEYAELLPEIGSLQK